MALTCDDSRLTSAGAALLLVLAPARNPQVLVITTTATDPAQATSIANVVVRSYATGTKADARVLQVGSSARAQRPFGDIALTGGIGLLIGLLIAAAISLGIGSIPGRGMRPSVAHTWSRCRVVGAAGQVPALALGSKPE